MRLLRLFMLIILFVSIGTALGGHIFIAWGLWGLLYLLACRYQRRVDYYRDRRWFYNQYRRDYDRYRRC